MRENSHKRKDSTVNQRAQRRIQRCKDIGGRAFSMLIDKQTNLCLQKLMSSSTETQAALVSRLIKEAASSSKLNATENK